MRPEWETAYLAAILCPSKLLRDLVDLVGFEPTTSSMPWKRAPSCATGPLAGNLCQFCAEAGSLVKLEASPTGVAMEYGPGVLFDSARPVFGQAK